jgi:hypothetical protein
MCLPKKSIESFDEKNGLLDLDRDCYLSIIQFLNTKVLRYFIGISEESFTRKNHLHYHLYRMKYNNIPIKNLLVQMIDPFLEYHGRTVTGINGLRTITLNEPIFESIFELKLKYIKGVCITVKQADPNINFFGKNYNTKIMISGHCIRKNAFLFKEHHHLGQTVDVTYCHKKHERNVLTLILDMRKYEDKLYFKINDFVIKYAIVNNPHVPKLLEISLECPEEIEFISNTYLNRFPEDILKQFIKIIY